MSRPNYDPVRLIHSSTDFHRALAIAYRLAEMGDDPRTGSVLELALLADYSRPFIGLAEMSAPLTLEGLGEEFSDEEEKLHRDLMELAKTRAAQRRDSAEPFELRGDLLDGIPIDDVIALVSKLRRAVTCCLYPGIANDPETLQLLIGPLKRGA